MMKICLILLVLQLSTAYVNIAHNKPAWQQYPYPNGPTSASKAVDGLKSNLVWNGGQCTISDFRKQTATWRVDLEDILSIRHITIYYRTDSAAWGPSNGLTGRFLGFSLYVSNTTDRTQGKLCFHDNKHYTIATIPAALNVTCPVHGRYVIYYNERKQGLTYPDGYSTYAYNDLCEVEVHGCPVPGYYGSDCSISCPDTNCRYCHIETGTCQGCKPGYKGHHCELSCSHQYYGELCKQTCGNCSDGATCNNVNGVCPNGCDVGVYGTDCKTPCPAGWYGKNCSLTCTNCDTCDRFTGQCTATCSSGWKGILCTDECDGGKYGDECNKDCGACLGYTQCHHINGACLQGCDAGYKGELCETKCSPGYYGKNCEQNCSDNCNDDPTVCNRTTGECVVGCRPGWEGAKCESECSEKKYGANCAFTCGKCRDGEACHHVKGDCGSGCDRGYEGAFCKKGCALKFHGYNCENNCSKECKNENCSAITGKCFEIVTSQGDKAASDDNNLTPIIGGVVGVVLVCLLVVVIVLVLRRHKSHGQGEKTPSDLPSHKNNLQEDFSSLDKKRPSSSKEIIYINSENKKPLISQKKSYEAEVDEDELIHSENPYGDAYLNEMTIPDIPLNRLESVIAEKRKQNDDGFQREYATLPYGEQYPCEAGKKGENIVKNRFKTTFPYDHSRVILKTGADYINANYIEGAERNREYIAAQGTSRLYNRLNMYN